MRGLNLPKVRKFVVPCSIWKRLLAFIIDLLIIDFIIVTPFKPLLSEIFPAEGSYSYLVEVVTSDAAKMGMLVNVMLVITVLALTYFTILEWKLHQTIGKIVFNVYIRSETKVIGFWQVLISNLSLIPFFPFVVFWIVDPIHIFLSPKNIRLMEKLVRLQLVEEQYG